MTIRHTTTLRATPERIWQEVLTPKLLAFVAKPLIHFVPDTPPAFPQHWGNNKHLVKLRVFGFLPFGTQWIVTSIEREDTQRGQQAYTLRDNGYSDMITKWDHWIFIEELPDGFTRYTDQIEVQAGILTPCIGIFAWIFYWHRQRRWRSLVKQNFKYQ